MGTPTSATTPAATTTQQQPGGEDGGRLGCNLTITLLLNMDHINSTPAPVPQYFPDDGDINFWTFAMFGISTTFLVFVGFSIVIMCKGDASTVQRTRQT